MISCPQGLEDGGKPATDFQSDRNRIFILTYFAGCHNFVWFQKNIKNTGSASLKRNVILTNVLLKKGLVSGRMLVEVILTKEIKGDACHADYRYPRIPNTAYSACGL